MYFLLCMVYIVLTTVRYGRLARYEAEQRNLIYRTKDATEARIQIRYGLFMSFQKAQLFGYMTIPSCKIKPERV